MSDTMDDKELITKLLNKIKIEEEEIRQMELSIKAGGEKIAHLKKELWASCSHCWVRDHFALWDDICKHYCSVCGLWKDKSIYT